MTPEARDSTRPAENFGDLYAGLVAERKPGLLPEFDLSQAVVDAELRAGRQSKYV